MKFILFKSNFKKEKESKFDKDLRLAKEKKNGKNLMRDIHLRDFTDTYKTIDKSFPKRTKIFMNFFGTEKQNVLDTTIQYAFHCKEKVLIIHKAYEIKEMHMEMSFDELECAYKQMKELIKERTK